MRKLKWVEEATKKLESTLGRHPSAAEIAAALEMSKEEYEKLLGELSYGIGFSIDELVGFDEPVSAEQFIKNEKSIIPEEEFLLSEKNEMLARAIDELPEKEKQVVVCYYYNEMTLHEIADYLKRSEGRISQLHTQAMIRLRSKLAGGE
jgi:RNA polymerase sigma factor for flagellar operon FliA